MNNDSPKNARSFWSDLERSKSDDPGSSPASSMSSPRTPLLNSVKNSTFIVSDKSPQQPFKTSPTIKYSSPPGQHSFESRQKHSISPSPSNRQKSIASISPVINFDSTFSQFPKPPQPVNRNIALLKKSSLLRTGSVGRLQGPRTIGSSSNLKPKKVVKFEKAAPQVIQYETLTPELSLNMINDSQFLDQNDSDNTYSYDEGENRRLSEESDPHSLLEDDGYNNIPVVEPPLYGIAISSPIPGIASQEEEDRSDSASRRPLPQLPPDSTSSSPVEKMASSPITSGTAWTTATYSPSDSPYISSSNVFRQNSLLDSQRKIVTLHHTGQTQVPTHVEINRSVLQQKRYSVEAWNKGSDEGSSPEIVTKQLPEPPGAEGYYGRSLPAIKEDRLSTEVYENYTDYNNVDSREEYDLYHNSPQYDHHEYDDPYYDHEHLDQNYPDRHYDYSDNEEASYHLEYEDDHYPYKTYQHPRHSSEGYCSRRSSESYQRSQHSSGRDSQHSYRESYDEKSFSGQEYDDRNNYRKHYHEGFHTPEVIRRSLPFTPDSPHHSLRSYERPHNNELPPHRSESYDRRPNSRRGLDYEDISDHHEYSEDNSQKLNKKDQDNDDDQDSDDSRFQDHEPESSDDSYEDLPDDEDYEAEAEINSEDENDENDFENENTTHHYENHQLEKEEDISLENDATHCNNEENEDEEKEPAFQHGYRTVSNSNNDASFHHHYREFSPSQQDIPRDASFIHHPQDYLEPDYAAEEPMPNIKDYYHVPIKKELIDDLPLSKLSVQEPKSLLQESSATETPDIPTTNTTTTLPQDYSGQESSSPDINYPIGHPRSRVTSRSVSRSTSRSMSKIVSIKQEPEEEEAYQPVPSFTENSSFSRQSFENQSTAGSVASKTPDVEKPSVEPQIKTEPVDDYTFIPKPFKIKQEPIDDAYQNVSIKKEPLEEQYQNCYNSQKQNQYISTMQTGTAVMNTINYMQNSKISENYYIKQEPGISENDQHLSSQVKDVQQSMLTHVPFPSIPNQFNETADTTTFANEKKIYQNDYENQDESTKEQLEQEQSQNSEIPLNEPQTIVATGTNLRTRPSLTPGEVSKLSEINDSLQNKYSTENQQSSETSHIVNEISKVPVPMLTFDFDDIVSENESIFGDLDKEFDKVLNTEKVCYFCKIFYFYLFIFD